MAERWRWASGNQPRSVEDLVELLENYQVTQRLCSAATPAPGGDETRTERRGRMPENQRTQAPPAYPNQIIADRRGPAPQTPREEWRCYTYGHKGHLARHCPGAGDVSMPVRPTGEEGSVSAPPAGPPSGPNPQAYRTGLPDLRQTIRGRASGTPTPTTSDQTTPVAAYMAAHPAPSRSDSDESPDRLPRETHASSTVSLPPGTPDTMTASEQTPPPDGRETPPLIDFSDFPLADGGGTGRGVPMGSTGKGVTSPLY
ncbi:unnamed protein product [Boreogadus saida]